MLKRQPSRAKQRQQQQQEIQQALTVEQQQQQPQLNKILPHPRDQQDAIKKQR